MTSNPATPAVTDHARTSAGKRNWSVAAVHGQNRPPRGPADVPESPGGFADLLSVLNPLRQVPLVGKSLAGQSPASVTVPARILGGLLLGGPVGFMLGVGSTIFSQALASEPVLTPEKSTGYGSSLDIKA